MIQGFDIKVLAKLQTIYDLITSSPPGSTTWGSITGTLSSQTDLQSALNAKQDTLVSGTNIKTINTNSLLGSGDLSVHDLPTGGTEGQILAKNSATNYDTTWIDNYTSTVQHTVKLAESINIGQAVYVSSANGTNIIVSKADNSTEATSSKTMGLLAFTGATNATGFVVTEGLLAGLNTSTANAAGDPVWLGTNGNLIYGLANKPVAPAHLVFIGIVTRKQSNNGEIFIKVQNGFELQELHNVDAVNPSNNDGIFYNTSTSLWEHKSIATVLGYTPYSAANPSGYITSSALSGYLTSATAASTYYPLTNPSSYISGITSLMVTTALGYTPYSNANPSGYITSSALSPYLTSATAASTYQPIGTYATASNSMSFTNKSGNISQWTNDSAYITSSALSPYLTSATAASTYQTILSAASASANGYLTSTDWSTFNNKQAAITLTTTGTSGAATLVGSTLNIPQYASVGSGASMLYSSVQSATSITAGTTVYGGFINGAYQTLANEYLRIIPLPKNTIVSNFTVYALAQPATGTSVYTVRKNSVDTALVITIPSGSAAAFHTNTVTTVSFNALDYISVKAVNNASSPVQPVSLSIICTI